MSPTIPTMSTTVAANMPEPISGVATLAVIRLRNSISALTLPATPVSTARTSAAVIRSTGLSRRPIRQRGRLATLAFSRHFPIAALPAEFVKRAEHGSNRNGSGDSLRGRD